MENLLELIILGALTISFFIDMVLYLSNYERMDEREKFIGSLPFGMFFQIKKLKDKE